LKYFLALLLFASTLPVRADDLDFTALRYLTVFKDVRKKPLDTVALETVRKLTGRSTWTDPATGQKLEAMDALLSMWLETREWSDTPVILATYEPLKKQLGLALDQKLFTYKQIATPKFEEILQQIQAKERRNAELNRDDREARQLMQRLDTLGEVVGAETLLVVPPPTTKDKWQPIPHTGEYYGEAVQTALTKTFKDFAGAYIERNPGAFSLAAQDLVKQLRALNPAIFPPVKTIQREVEFNAIHPFRKAWLLYALAALVTLVTWRMRGTYWIGFGAFVAGMLMHAYAFYLRLLISGRPPVTNMYESVVWVSFTAALFAVILEAIYRQRYYIVGVAPLSVVMLILADQFPAVLDPSIGPLMPVLRDNFWLTVHVPTITAGYAAFMVALGIGHIALGYYLFAPGDRDRIRQLEKFIYRAMQIGVLCIAAGTILGGIWAHYAWGRFWGWDPKEVWALITLLCYLVPLHGRLSGWLSNFALTIASVVCFLPVLMAWYGVNFILGTGKHSYGFGVGGFSYALTFVAFELTLVAVALFRRKQHA